MGVAVSAGLDFVPAAQASAALEAAEVPDQAAAVVDAYTDAQRQALRIGMLAAAGIALASPPATAALPARAGPTRRRPGTVRGA